jgi:hypothetical protein
MDFTTSAAVPEDRTEGSEKDIRMRRLLYGAFANDAELSGNEGRI